MSDKTCPHMAAEAPDLSTRSSAAIATFPLWAPPLARSLHLTSSQLNLLASSAILGEYATAALWGAIADSYGPGAVSSGAGAAFALGYGLMGLVANVGARLDRQGKEINKLLWGLLCITYFLAGCGVAGSYFSAMISSTKSAPARHSGLGERCPPASCISSKFGRPANESVRVILAIGVPCAVFGLSPLFLSSLASFFTTDYDRFPNLPGTSERELDPARWLLFLAATLAIVNGIGGLFLKELPWEEKVQQVDKLDSEDIERSVTGHADEANERTSLLPPRTRSRSSSQSVPALNRRRSSSEACPSRAHHHHHHHHHHPHSQTLRQFVSTPTFWLFGSIILLSTGPVESYMASLGQILESLLAISTSNDVSAARAKGTISHALQARKNHIAVLAIANTLSRLLVGAVSDYLSAPSVTVDDEGGPSTPARKRVSRLAFLLGACASLALAYVWGGTGLTTEDGLWIVTIS